MPTKKTQGQDAQGGSTIAGLVTPLSIPKNLMGSRIKHAYELRSSYLIACIYGGITNIASSIISLYPVETFLVTMGVPPRESCEEAVQKN